MLNEIVHGDCLEVMPSIPDKSIDMILCDLPYGTTACKWDTVIPFEPLWKEYKRLIKDNGAIVLTASQPFTSALVMSNPDMFRYDWVWDKRKPSNFLNANRTPLMKHESVLIFYNLFPVYNPQKTTGKTRYKGGKKYANNGCYGDYGEYERVQYNEYFPKSIIEISNAKQKGKVHPTQKPVALFEYLIRTYTNEGETVLDNCIGSGTTAIACINTNRNFIGIEKEEKYVGIARKRIAEYHRQMSIV